MQQYPRTAMAAVILLCSTTPVAAAQSVATPPGRGMSDIGFLSAAALATKCKAGDVSSISYCFAYVAAVTDTARAYEIWLNAKEFCLPAQASQSLARRAFLTYLDAYPAQASGQAASVVINALKQTYPCG